MAVVLLNLVSKYKHVRGRKNCEKRISPFLNKDYEYRLMSLPFSSFSFYATFCSSVWNPPPQQLDIYLKIDAVLFEELNQKKKKDNVLLNKTLYNGSTRLTVERAERDEYLRATVI